MVPDVPESITTARAAVRPARKPLRDVSPRVLSGGQAAAVTADSHRGIRAGPRDGRTRVQDPLDEGLVVTVPGKGIYVKPRN